MVGLGQSGIEGTTNQMETLPIPAPAPTPAPEAEAHPEMAERVRPVPPREEILAALHGPGYFVVRGYLSPGECAHARRLVWDWLEQLTRGRVSRYDPKTWTTENWPHNQGGLIQHYGVGWSKVCVQVRAWVAGLFREMFGTRRVVTSFDGMGVRRAPARGHAKYADQAARESDIWRQPFHLDQTVPSDDFQCVQSRVSLTAEAEDGACFSCIPESWKYHAEVLALYGKRHTPGWEKLNPAQLAFYKSKGLEPVCVFAGEGDVVLWRSDLAHCGSQATAAADKLALRIGTYVSMAPVRSIKNFDAQRKKRLAAYSERRTSRHRADKIQLFAKSWRTFGKEDAQAYEAQRPVRLTMEEEQLHGLMPY